MMEINWKKFISYSSPHHNTTGEKGILKNQENLAE